MSLKNEVLKRRTFAIISHPDAGKTTLTEKFLLYGGAIQLAGSVSAKKQQRQATSDWMELEKQRGISISSTVLNFDYNNYRVNILDTPGHQDFSEDTYRTLMAADSVIMLIDNAKGVETQTKKLFQVSKRRGLPVATFINKMDRFGKEPLALLDEVEELFGIKTYPFLWPIGMGDHFKGVYDRTTNKIHLYDRTEHGQYKAPVDVTSIHDPVIKDLIGDDNYKQLVEEIEILDVVGNDYSEEAFLSGELTPVFFGSAMTNFGIELFLNKFLTMAPSPGPRICHKNGLIPPDDEDFSGFVFKIQANMDPLHRDSVAFIRICSGQFSRDMTVKHPKTGKTVRLSYSHKLFGQEREIVNEGFAGDVIGISSNQGIFSIGDTVCNGKTVQLEAVPQFPPELFALIRNPNPSKYKQYQKGIEQLGLEGAIQRIFVYDSPYSTSLILGAVGHLQFEVFQYRMKSEYNVDVLLETLPEYTHARWLQGSAEALGKIEWSVNSRRAEDAHGNPMALLKGEWSLNYMQEKNPNIQFLEAPASTTPD